MYSCCTGEKSWELREKRKERNSKGCKRDRKREGEKEMRGKEKANEKERSEKGKRA
jgi:hypothetical protein